MGRKLRSKAFKAKLRELEKEKIAHGIEMYKKGLEDAKNQMILDKIEKQKIEKIEKDEKDEFDTGYRDGHAFRTMFPLLRVSCGCDKSQEYADGWWKGNMDAYYKFLGW